MATGDPPPPGSDPPPPQGPAMVGEDPPPPGSTVIRDDDTAEFPPPQIDAEEVAGLQGSPGSIRLGPPVYTVDGRPIQDEASKMVGQYLFPTEKFRGEWK